MKVFNILFPYSKKLPSGKGDELGLKGFYTDGKPDIEGNDLKDCHPDNLRDKILADKDDAVADALKNNGVENINDMFSLQQ